MPSTKKYPLPSLLDLSVDYIITDNCLNHFDAEDLALRKSNLYIFLLDNIPKIGHCIYNVNCIYYFKNKASSLLEAIIDALIKKKKTLTYEELAPLIARPLQVRDLSKHEMSWNAYYFRAWNGNSRPQWDQQQMQHIHRLVRLAAQRQCVRHWW